MELFGRQMSRRNIQFTLVLLATILATGALYAMIGSDSACHVGARYFPGLTPNISANEAILKAANEAAKMPLPRGIWSNISYVDGKDIITRNPNCCSVEWRRRGDADSFVLVTVRYKVSELPSLSGFYEFGTGFSRCGRPQGARWGFPIDASRAERR